MSKSLKTFALCLIATATALPLAAAPYGLGRAVLPEEIAAWDVDVMPDGRGLPEGQGDVLTGEAIFTEKCAACHGDFAEGRGNCLRWRAGRTRWRMPTRSRRSGPIGRICRQALIISAD